MAHIAFYATRVAAYPLVFVEIESVVCTNEASPRMLIFIRTTWKSMLNYYFNSIWRKRLGERWSLVLVNEKWKKEMNPFGIWFLYRGIDDTYIRTAPLKVRSNHNKSLKIENPTRLLTKEHAIGNCFEKLWTFFTLLKRSHTNSQLYFPLVIREIIVSNRSIVVSLHFNFVYRFIFGRRSHSFGLGII